MSFFSALASAASTVFSGGAGVNLIAAAASIGSVIVQNRANKAAESAARAGSEAQAAALREGNEQARVLLEQQLKFTEPARARLSGISRIDPGEFTPEQQREIDSFRRDAATRLATSGLRGAGRSGVAAVNEGEAALRARLITSNQARADRATELLARSGERITQDVAGINRDIGRATGAAAETAGTLESDRRVANAENFGEALGAIASTIRTGEKEKGRPSRFEDDRLRRGVDRI